MLPERAEATRSNCAGTRKNGGPCAAPVLGVGDYCYAHNPDVAEARTAARQRGGYGRAATRRVQAGMPGQLAAVHSALLRALTAVEAGTLPPNAASAMAAVARVVVMIWQVSELESRVRALEEAEQ